MVRKNKQEDKKGQKTTTTDKKLTCVQRPHAGGNKYEILTGDKKDSKQRRVWRNQDKNNVTKQNNYADMHTLLQ